MNREHSLPSRHKLTNPEKKEGDENKREEIHAVWYIIVFALGLSAGALIVMIKGPLPQPGLVTMGGGLVLALIVGRYICSKVSFQLEQRRYKQYQKRREEELGQAELQREQREIELAVRRILMVMGQMELLKTGSAVIGPAQKMAIASNAHPYVREELILPAWNVVRERYLTSTDGGDEKFIFNDEHLVDFSMVDPRELSRS